jgi:hypothetical protein
MRWEAVMVAQSPAERAVADAFAGISRLLNRA